MVAEELAGFVAAVAEAADPSRWVRVMSGTRHDMKRLRERLYAAAPGYQWELSSTSLSPASAAQLYSRLREGPRPHLEAVAP